jgi:hypothetical protein
MTLLTTGTSGTTTGVTDQQNYPFDRYTRYRSSTSIDYLPSILSYYCDLFVFAQRADTNETVGVTIRSTSGVAVYVHLLYVLIARLITTHRGYWAAAQRVPGTPDSSPYINNIIAISRSGLVRAYALVIVITMCKS